MQACLGRSGAVQHSLSRARRHVQIVPPSTSEALQDCRLCADNSVTSSCTVTSSSSSSTSSSREHHCSATGSRSSNLAATLSSSPQRSVILSSDPVNYSSVLRCLHSAALASPSPRITPSEAAALLHLKLAPQVVGSSPPITDVHGTLNTVLWGIPMIVNQMRSKSPEGEFDSRDLIQAFAAQNTFREGILSGRLNELAGSVCTAQNLDLLLRTSETPALPAKVTDRTIEVETDLQIEELQEDAKSKHKKLLRRQVKIESEAWERAAQEYRETLEQLCKNKLASSLPFMKSMFVGWFEPLCNAIAAEQKGFRNSEHHKYRSSYGPYLNLLSPEKLAVITMHKTVAKLLTDTESNGLRVVTAAMSIGEAVEQEVRLQEIMKRKSRKKGKGTEESVTVAGQEEIAKHKALQKEVKKLLKQKRLRVIKKVVRETSNSEPWSKAALAKIGCRLLELLIENAYIQDPGDNSSGESVEVRPAFRHIFKTFVGRDGSAKDFSTSRRYGIIECDSFISRGIHKMAKGVVTPYMPMLVKPLPWQGYRRGGYIVLPSCIMRTHGARELGQTLKNTPKHQLQTIFEALDTLGLTKWKIQTRLLEVVEKIWEGGGRLANMVDRDDVPVPERPETDDVKVLKKWRWENFKARRLNRELHSQRCDTELKLAIARKMKEEECFYYPHNIDFRGRAYPMHPHLNHLGSDMCRGLLQFAEGRPLGCTGLQWLKVHLANVYGNGIDKLSFSKRAEFVDQNLDNILDSARSPLNGQRWWLEAEDPFQCLATCMEISDALACANPESFISHLPVHQDGSCNGLQHYAALGRDVLGAESVNLTLQDKPADVYSEIASRVSRILQEDTRGETTNLKDTENARLLDGHVDRKLVKQTVMTSVYGVTYVGARDQILNRLLERLAVTDEQRAFQASCYAAKTTLAALGEMFKAARVIMGWLGDCAKIIASRNEPVRWRTPLGLPVVQPYRKPSKILVKTSLQNLTITLPNDTKVMVKRQKSAFPPNFVHSLDSTHMMMTAVGCKKAGLTFAGVHDSFWTHAGDIDKMNVILREKFVELYSQPILENLLSEFKTNFPKAEFPSVPNRGDFNLQEVMQAPYFFN